MEVPFPPRASSNPDVPPLPAGSLPQTPAELAVQQMARDVRMARNIELAILAGKAVPVLLVVILFIWIFAS
ncbi:hypothetical protein [Bradyrhizobium sp. SZCCHNR3118]|uniref:hypothetical protein n=1 Tax=Bradyrhizobium sp. SZCCHNR3118 TaxID=3057468 RepID=UPI0029164D8A|nr:hypothetical protein [Bradyrhizobium sp. SZCCHNR3118]